MSKMPPTCTDCGDADATHPDGWCDECAAMRDDHPNAPACSLSRPDWASMALRGIFAPPSVQSPPAPGPGVGNWPPRAVKWPLAKSEPGPSDTEPRYRFPF